MKFEIGKTYQVVTEVNIRDSLDEDSRGSGWKRLFVGDLIIVIDSSRDPAYYDSGYYCTVFLCADGVIGCRASSVSSLFNKKFKCLDDNENK